MTPPNQENTAPRSGNPQGAAGTVIGSEGVTPEQSQAARRHPLIFAAVALLSSALLALAIIGQTVARHTQLSFDRAVLLAMRDPGPAGTVVPEGPDWVRQAMIDITAMGGETVLTLIVAGAIGLLLIQRHVLTAVLLAASVISGSVAVALAKVIFGRVRPDVIDHLVHVGSASFPSGHSANSALVYISLAILLAQIVRSSGQRIYIVVLAVALAATIGFSRIYLGVHWPSDVIGGLAFGTLWALGWWAIGSMLRQRYAGQPLPRPD